MVHMAVDLPAIYMTLDSPVVHMAADFPAAHMTLDLPAAHTTLDFPEQSAGNSLLSVGAFCGQGGRFLYIHLLLRIYRAGAGVLFHDLPVHLEGLSEDLAVFLHRYVMGVSFLSVPAVCHEMGDSGKHALCFDDRVLSHRLSAVGNYKTLFR